MDNIESLYYDALNKYRKKYNHYQINCYQDEAFGFISGEIISLDAVRADRKSIAKIDLAPFGSMHFVRYDSKCEFIFKFSKYDLITIKLPAKHISCGDFFEYAFYKPSHTLFLANTYEPEVLLIKPLEGTYQQIYRLRRDYDFYFDSGILRAHFIPLENSLLLINENGAICFEFDGSVKWVIDHGWRWIFSNIENNHIAFFDTGEENDMIYDVDTGERIDVR